MVDDARYGVPAASLSAGAGVQALGEGVIFAAIAAWAMGVPWPGASTCGSSLASAATDLLAVGQLQVDIHGGPETRCLILSRSHKELKLRVSTASPCDQDPVTGPEKRRRGPGVRPGVGMHSQSGSPGTPASRFNTCAASMMLALYLRRCAPDKSAAPAAAIPNKDRANPNTQPQAPRAIPPSSFLPA